MNPLIIGIVAKITIKYFESCDLKKLATIPDNAAMTFISPM